MGVPGDVAAGDGSFSRRLALGGAGGLGRGCGRSSTRRASEFIGGAV